MIKTLLKSVRQYKRQSLLSPLFVAGEVVLECIIPLVMSKLIDHLSADTMTPILKSDSMELGYGNMDLVSMVTQAQKVKVDAVILESHKNWVDNSPLKSMELSAEFMNQYIR